MRVKIAKRYYNLEFVRIRGDAWGYCDSPEKPGKRILIHKSLRGKHLMEVAIHEVLHALQWHIDEKHIEEAARDIANVLDKIGYKFIR